MSKHTLSNKSRYSILKLSGFRARTATAQGRKTLKNRDKDCQLVRRRGRVYVINKKNPRFKARQG